MTARCSRASWLLEDVVVRVEAVNEGAPVQPSCNVAGLLPGNDPRLRDPAILVRSHFDQLGVQNGVLCSDAYDSGPVTVAMLEVGRRLARHAQRPVRVVRV